MKETGLFLSFDILLSVTYARAVIYHSVCTWITLVQCPVWSIYRLTPQSDFLQRCAVVSLHAQSLAGETEPLSLASRRLCRWGSDKSPLSSRESDVFLQNLASVTLACSVPGERRVAGESISQRRTGTASPLFSVFKFNTFWLCYMKNMGLMAKT